ncbi:zinc ribbon domain-containing protein [Catellatospora coxensis]
MKADRWYPSSKTCSNCGAVKTKLPLHVRVFNCEQCPWSWTVTRTRPVTSPPSRRQSRLVPEWPETRTRKRRTPVEPTVRPAPPPDRASCRVGGQVAQHRTSGQKRDPRRTEAATLQ